MNLSEDFAQHLAHRASYLAKTLHMELANNRVPTRRELGATRTEWEALLRGLDRTERKLSELLRAHSAGTDAVLTYVALRREVQR